MLRSEDGPKPFVQPPADKYTETLLCIMYKMTFDVQSLIFSVRKVLDSALLSLALDKKFMTLHIIFWL